MTEYGEKPERLVKINHIKQGLGGHGEDGHSSSVERVSSAECQVKKPEVMAKVFKDQLRHHYS